MLYKNTKAIVRSFDGDTDFFNFVVRVLQKDTLAPFLFITCLRYVQQTLTNLMKETGFTLKKKKKARSRRYPTETITDAGYTDDLELLTNTAKAELLHNLG